MSGPLLIGILMAAILFVILATPRWNVHPFLVLLAASYDVGLTSGLSASRTIEAISDGFGGTIGYIGIVIAAVTIIGAILEQTGGAQVLADAVLRVVGRARVCGGRIDRQCRRVCACPLSPLRDQRKGPCRRSPARY